VEVLKEYLKFAETGELDLATPSGRGPDSPFEEAVADRLREKGYDIEHQVGVAGFYIDLAVRDPERPGRYLLGIECDGATYHSARMARVRDRTRQAVLEGLGWTIHRIWSTDWFRNPEDELGKVVAAIERAQVKSEAGKATGDGRGAPEAKREQERNQKEKTEVPKDRETEIERAEEEGEDDDALPVEPYEKAYFTAEVQDSLHEEPTRRLGKWIRKVVETESPVHEEIAARRVTDIAGASRMGSRIQDALSGAIDYASEKGWVRKKEHLLFDPEQEDIPIRSREDLDGRARDIEYIPGPEIAEAAEEIARVSFEIEKEELVQQVGRQLGFKRVGSNIQERIGSIIDTMLEREMLVRENGQLSIPEPKPSE
jgi:very-short-patch-repair endonuclease